MGGMISRFYLDRVMTEADVAQLIVLGTPMAGSSCANLPAALGLLLPATLEIQPAYMTDVFNQQIVHRRGVPFYALAGTKLLDAIQSPCTPVPSDLVVTVDSVKAIPMPVQEIDLLHTELNTSPRVFEEFVTPLLQTPPGQFEIGEDLLAHPAPSVSQQFTRVYTGHLDPGETQQVVINIDANVTVANFALYDTSRSLEVTPQASGVYGIQVNVTAVAPYGMPIDRAAFLSFEVQPVQKQFTMVRYFTLGGMFLAALILLAGILFALRARKRRIRL
jgi:hypothetical protein